MLYKVLIAIDWENINSGNKTDWNFIKNYPQNSVIIYVFHSDIQKTVPPVFPHIPVVYEPTPKQEQINGAKNCTDRHIIKTVLKKVLNENYNEVVIVSDDKGFEKLTALLQHIDIKVSIEYSDLKKLRQYKTVERILSLLETNGTITYAELENSYSKRYNTHIEKDCNDEIKLSLVEVLKKLIATNYVQSIENKYCIKSQVNTQDAENEVIENLEAVIQVLRNKHKKGDILDRSSLFNTIKSSKVFADKFSSKTAKDKLITQLLEKKIIKITNEDKFEVQ